MKPTEKKRPETKKPPKPEPKKPVSLRPSKPQPNKPVLLEPVKPEPEKPEEFDDDYDDYSAERSESEDIKLSRDLKKIKDDAFLAEAREELGEERSAEVRGKSDRCSSRPAQ